MPGPENSAWGRSVPGSGPTPIYDANDDLAIFTRSRVETPPIVESQDETVEEIYAKQWNGKDDT